MPIRTQLVMDVADAAIAKAIEAACAALEMPVWEGDLSDGTLPTQWPLLVVTDASLERVHIWKDRLQSRGMDPRRSLVHVTAAVEREGSAFDQAMFTSVEAPATPAAAIAMMGRLLKALGSDTPAQRSLPAAHAPMTGVSARLLEAAARHGTKVLLVGETGTGKNTLARWIHDATGRTGPFVELNCAALPESLIESELFGAEAGAYTGAMRSRPGRFELADRGTLFLDEIDSLPLHLQAKLLGAIQDGGTTRLGDHRFRPSDFKLICASQQPVESMVAKGRFRADLMHRIAVVEIHLPSVRDLGAHVLASFESMLQSECERLGVARVDATRYYATVLAHSWPGNFRELAAAAQRCALGLPILRSAAPPRTSPCGLRDQLQDIERELISRTVASCGGSVRAASEMLQLPLETLRYRMRTLGITSRALQPLTSDALAASDASASSQDHARPRAR